MNKVIIMGRLTRDPEIRYSQGSEPISIARYALAVDRRGSKKEEQAADFISCVAFRGSAEFAQKYFHQGQRVLVSGRLQTGSYTNKDGQKVYTTDVVVEEQEFADSKNTGSGQTQSESQAASEGFMNIPDGVEDEGLPFK